MKIGEKGLARFARGSVRWLDVFDFDREDPPGVGRRVFDPGFVVIPFGYCRDRLFLLCCLLYAGNRWLVKPLAAGDFFHSHFNDLLLVPCALPLMVLLHRKMGLRSHDRPPTAGEIVFHFVIWAVLFEGIGPLWVTHATGDPLDIVAYAVGAVLAGFWWNRNRAPSRRLA